MITRKNPRVDLERSKGLFFLIGLACALGLAIFTLELESPRQAPEAPKQTVNSSMEPWDIPTLPRSMPELPKRTAQTRTPDPTVEPVVKPIKLSTEPVKLPETLEPVGSEPLIKEEPEPMIPMLIEKIARPTRCKSLSDKEAALRCLNNWLKDYLRQEVNYPSLAKQLGVEEKIIVKFVIDKKGRVGDIVVLRGDDPALVAEARRVIESLPRFEPANQQGRPVPMLMTVPVSFRLQ